ncbi:MAG: response regulator [Bacteroidetes bacterium]|nr:MAG: response regulator [Bacteroidota bacterium]
MNYRVLSFSIFLFLTLPYLGYVNASNKVSASYDLHTWEDLSDEEKSYAVQEWISKSSDRIRWSHNARMDFAKTAYHHASELGETSLKMAAMYCLAELYFNEALFDTALSYFDSIYEYAESLEDKRLKIEMYNYTGSIFRYKGNIFDALGLTYDAYRLAMEKGYYSLIALSANNLGVIYRNLGENKIAIGYYNEALEKGILAADTNQIITSYAGMGNFYWFEKDVQRALEYYQKAMQLARQSHDMQHIASLNNNIGNIYREREDYDTALFYYSTAYDLLEEVNVVGLKAVILRNIGLVHQRKGNYQQALNYVNQSLAIVTEVGITSFMRDNYFNLSQIYSAMGNIEESYRYLQLFTDYNQQIYNSQLLNRISYFNEKVTDAQRKEELYRFRLERNFFILIIVILFLVFLALFSILMFGRFKEKRKHIERLKSTLQDKVITEKALRQSEENYQTLIKTLNEGLIVLGQDNIIEFVNLKACKVLGATDKSQLIGKHFEKFMLTPDDEKLFLEKVELQKMGISDHYEIKMKNLAEDVMWANLSSAPILDENLRSKGCVALISDVTEKKKSEQTYSELTTSLNQKIKQLNCLYDITDISGAPGITFEDIMEKSLEIIPVGLKYSHDIGVQIVFDKKTYSSLNFRDTNWSYSVPIKVQKKKLGFIKVVYLEEKPIINKDPFHFSEKILLKNISEKFGQIIESKNLEKVLRENQDKLEEVQRIAKIGNWEKNLHSDDCVFSETFFDILDISPEKRKFYDYSKLLEIIHPDDKVVFLNFEKKLLKKDAENNITANYRIITHEGVIKHMFSSGKIIRNEKGERVNSVFTVQDITEQKYTQELQHHAEIALKTSEAKQQVLANMSYEMRTPITGIMGMVDFLFHSGLSKEQMELAETIKDSSIGLLNTINNILDLQRMEAGKFRLNKNVFSLSQLSDKISSLFAALTRSKEIQLDINIQKTIPKQIISDQTRLYQVITNLISIITENANKGRVKVEFKLENIVDNRAMFMVEVSNSLINLDTEAINTILNPSRVQDDFLLLKKDNLSVGLAISRKLVDMLEGSIGVEQDNEKGTVFYFTFFATLPSAEVIKEEKSLEVSPEKILGNIKGVKVLCVEDQKINQKVLALMLAHAQCNTIMANNGKEALELMDENDFDIVLLDMVMPVMDGLETLQMMKLKSKIYPPVIALSANVLDEDKDNYFAAGVNDFISKPINAAELYKKIDIWNGQYKKSKRQKTKK